MNLFFANFSIKLVIKNILSGMLFLLFFSFSISAQNTVDCINTNKIPQKHKNKFIHNKYLYNISSLDSLHPDCYKIKNSGAYHFQTDSFIIKENINKVWQKYKTISLKDSYCGNLVNLGFVYSKKKKKIYYINDDYEGINVGQIYFIRLNLLGGLKHIIVAFEVTKIDDAKKMMQFCYIERGISEGSQRVYLYKTKEGFTKIKHNTFYKSQSKIRDRWFYPKFHKKIVAELHHNLIKALTVN